MSIVLRRIFALTADLVRSRGTTHLYLSSSESRNTVDFYLARGAHLADPPTPPSSPRSPKTSVPQ